MSITSLLQMGASVNLPETASIVTDQLLIHIDAADPASYSGSGSTWSDISGNSNDATLVGSPTYTTVDAGGEFYFDGATQYGDFGINQSFSEATFCMWIKRDGAQAASAGLMFSRSSRTHGFNFKGTNNTLGHHWDNGAWPYDSGLLVPDNEWAMIALAVQSTKADFYLYESTGSSTATNTATYVTVTIDELRLAYDDYSSTRSFKGYIGEAFLYDKALTSTEMTANFDATKSRYGL